MVIFIIVVACYGGGTTVGAGVGYAPPFLPFTLSINSRGEISINGASRIVTPIGVFSILADVTHTFTPQNGSVALIVRHKYLGSVVDEIFQVGADEIVAVVDGLTIISVTDRRIFIDATNGTIKSINVKRVDKPPPLRIPQQTLGLSLPLADPLTFGKHSAGWAVDPHNGGRPPRYCRFDTDGLHVGPATWVGNILYCVNDSLQVDNAEVSVETTLMDRGAPDYYGNTGFGIYWKGCDLFDFRILDDGTWFWASLLPSGLMRSSAIHRGVGVKNKLSLRKRRAYYELFVNDVKIDSKDMSANINIAPDRTCEGPVGFVSGKGQHVVFSNLHIIQLRD